MLKNIFLTLILFIAYHLHSPLTNNGFASISAYDHLINKFAMKYGLDPALVKAVIKVESNFNKLAVSPKGASGLMQIMPETAKLLSVENIFCPSENINAGARFLSNMLILFDGDIAKALAAYNAGPGKVEKYNGVPPYRETKNFIKRVMTYKRSFRTGKKVYYFTDENGSVVFFNK